MAFTWLVTLDLPNALMTFGVFDEHGQLAWAVPDADAELGIDDHPRPTNGGWMMDPPLPVTRSGALARMSDMGWTPIEPPSSEWTTIAIQNPQVPVPQICFVPEDQS